MEKKILIIFFVLIFLFPIDNKAQDLPGLDFQQYLEDYQDTWWFGTWSWKGNINESQAKWLLEANMRLPNFEFTQQIRNLNDYGIKGKITLPLMGYITVWEYTTCLKNVLKRYPNVRSLNKYGNFTYVYEYAGRIGTYEVADPAKADFKDFYLEVLKECYWNLYNNSSGWLGFALMADHPELPGIHYDGGGGNTREPNMTYYRPGFALSEESLQAFVNSSWFEHGQYYMKYGHYYQGRGPIVNMTTGEHLDGTKCLLWEIFVNKSKAYSNSTSTLTEIWDDLWNYHGGSPPRTGDHASFLIAMYWSKIRQALDEFADLTGRHFFLWKEGGAETYSFNTTRFGDVKEISSPYWYRSAGPGNGSFDSYPDTGIASMSSIYYPKDNDTRSKLWVEYDLGNPGNNGGRITSRQVGYMLQYFLPQHPTSVTIWDVKNEFLFNSSHLQYFLPYSRIVSRMRYTGDWLGLYNTTIREQTRGTISLSDTQIQWSLCGGKIENNVRQPFLFWFSNAGRRPDKTFYASDAVVNFTYDLSLYGMSGPWYAFDVATMSVVGEGNNQPVNLSFGIPAWSWRPIYIISGNITTSSPKYLYSSSKLTNETLSVDGNKLYLNFTGINGMYYKVAVKSLQRPVSVNKSTQTLQPVTNLSEILDHPNEGWYYDSNSQILIISYRDVSFK